MSDRAARRMLAVLLGAGALAPALPAAAANFNVGTDAELRNAITSAASNDTITFTANITLASALPQVTKNLTFNGGNFTLSGNNQFRGLLVQSGAVAINDLTIANAKAQGGKGGQGGVFGGGGGGGAGLGGALFVGSAAKVTLSNVTLKDGAAAGGSGSNLGSSSSRGGGGGGGFLGDGGTTSNDVGGQGGAGGGGNGSSGLQNNAQPGGFGGGGGGADRSPAAGGFGGGGGGVYDPTGPAPSPGGFGGGTSGSRGTGGGGAGLGGAIFVQQGGSLTVNAAATVSGNSVTGGAGGGENAQAGQGIGSGLFLQGNGSFTLAPGAGQTQTISDAIVDQTGFAGSGGSWSIVKNGAGTTILTGANAYSGGATVNGGTLQGNASSLKGNIALANNSTVAFNQSGNGTYAGVLSGNGGLAKSGTGDLGLTGTNSFSGPIAVTGGALLFASDASLGAAGNAISLNNGTIGSLGIDSLTIARAVTITNSGGIRADSSQGRIRQLTWSGAIGGNGQLVKSGSQEVILTGANTYAGGTKVVEGVLRVTGDANLGAAGTAITLNGGSIGSSKDTPAATTFTRNIVLEGDGGINVALHPITWAGNIGGNGQFIKSGTGVLTLTGTNSYAGGTLVQSGILQVASDDKLGAAGKGITLQGGGLWTIGDFTTARPVTLQSNGGIFQTDVGQTLTLTGALDGPGGFSTVGTGTVVLAGTSSYGGNINANGGTIRGNAATIRGNIVFDANAANPNARSVTFDQTADGTFAGNITGIGSLTKTGAGKLVLGGTNSYKGGTTVSQGTLQGTTRSLPGDIVNNATLTFDQAFDGTYAGAMSGGGKLIKTGSGKVTLTGVSTVGGGTSIDGGGLAVNNSLTSDITVNKGGVLSGVGNITGDIVNNGGTIEPGNSIGNLTVHGNLTWNGGVFGVEVNADGTSDRITILGAGHKATVNAGTLQVLPEPGTYVPNTRYTIITAPAGGIATFTDLSGGVGFLTPALSFDATNLYLSLVLASNAFRSAGLTPNQRAVGGALDSIAATGNTSGLIVTMANLSPSQGPAAFQALSPEPYADFGTVNARAGQLFSNAIGRQMAVERGTAIGTRSVALAEACNVACDETAPSRLSAWLSGIGGIGSAVGNGNASGLTYSLGGTAFGIGYRPDPRFLVGLAGGWVAGSQWVNGFTGNGNTSAVSVALYGSFNQSPEGRGFYADALAGYANSTNRLQRFVAIGGQSGIANGQTSASQFLGQFESGYKIGLPFPANTSISPFGRVQIGSINQAGFTETGSNLFNLAVASQTTTSVRTTFGADFGASFDMGGGRPLDIGLRLGWLHEFADTARPITASFAAAPVSQFTVYGATPQRDSAAVGFSASTAIGDRAAVFASYDGEVGGGTDNHALRVGFRMAW